MTDASLAAPIHAQATVCALIALGAAFYRTGWLRRGFWASVEKLTYYALFPSLIASTLAGAELGDAPWGRIAIGIAGPMLAAALLLAMVRGPLQIDGPRWTSLLQGAIRMNTYIGLAVASAVYGEDGLALAAVSVAVIVPLVNVICVAGLARHGRAARARPSYVRSLACNPLILASVVGIGLNVLTVPAPPIVDSVAATLGRAALPLGLMAVGAALRVEALARVDGAEVVVTGIKLLALPAAVALALGVLGVRGVALATPTLFAALPTAPSAYILARVLGGDQQAMATLVALQTLASALTLPLVLACLAVWAS